MENILQEDIKKPQIDTIKTTLESRKNLSKIQNVDINFFDAETDLIEKRIETFIAIDLKKNIVITKSCWKSQLIAQSENFIFKTGDSNPTEKISKMIF